MMQRGSGRTRSNSALLPQGNNLSNTLALIAQQAQQAALASASHSSDTSSTGSSSSSTPAGTPPAGAGNPAFRNPLYGAEEDEMDEFLSQLSAGGKQRYQGEVGEPWFCF
jgi:hypothetical protein